MISTNSLKAGNSLKKVSTLKKLLISSRALAFCLEVWKNKFLNECLLLQLMT